MSNQITFYAGKGSPYSTRIAIAIQETGAEVVKREFDYLNGDKPAWYIERLNPLGKFPTITYGPPHPIDQPAPESVKINESLVIMEFISDLYPQAGLVPKDPVQRAKARVFVSFIDTMIMPVLLGTIFIGTKDISELYTVFDFVQSRLPDDTQYAIGGEFSIADIAAAAIFSMVEVVLSNDLGIYKKGEGLKVYEVYNSPKYDKLREYVKRLLDRPGVKKSIDNEYYILNLSKKFKRDA